MEAKRGTKTEAHHRMNELLAKYNTGELYLMESLSKADQERVRVANMPLADYLNEWLELHRANVSILTYQGYYEIIHSRMMPYFAAQKLCVKDVTGDEINEFYLSPSAVKDSQEPQHSVTMHSCIWHSAVP